MKFYGGLITMVLFTTVIGHNCVSAPNLFETKERTAMVTDVTGTVTELRNLSGISSEGQFIVFVGDLKAIRFSRQSKAPSSSPAGANGKQVRPGVSVILGGVERASQWNIGRNQMMKPKDSAFEYAVVKLSLSWPASEKVFELASSDLEILDADGKRLDAEPLSAFQLMIEGSNENHPVELPYLIRKGVGIRSFRMGNALFDLRDTPAK